MLKVEEPVGIALYGHAGWLDYHLHCVPEGEYTEAYIIKFGDPDFKVGSVPVCNACQGEIVTC